MTHSDVNRLASMEPRPSATDKRDVYGAHAAETMLLQWGRGSPPQMISWRERWCWPLCRSFNEAVAHPTENVTVVLGGSRNPWLQWDLAQPRIGLHWLDLVQTDLASMGP